MLPGWDPFPLPVLQEQALLSTELLSEASWVSSRVISATLPLPPALTDEALRAWGLQLAAGEQDSAAGAATPEPQGCRAGAGLRIAVPERQHLLLPRSSQHGLECVPSHLPVPSNLPLLPLDKRAWGGGVFHRTSQLCPPFQCMTALTTLL